MATGNRDGYAVIDTAYDGNHTTITYLDENREVFGCEQCITLCDAYEYLALEEYC